MEETNWRIAFTTSKEGKRMLHRLVEYGLYGRTVGEVARRIVEAHLAKMLSDNVDFFDNDV